MNDEIEKNETTEPTTPYLKVELSEIGAAWEWSPDMRSMHLFGLAQQLMEFARAAFTQEMLRSQPDTQKQIAIARGIPSDHLRKRN